MRYQFLTLLTAFGVLLASNAVVAQDDDVIITVDSTNLQFSPADITINEGQAVRFFWSGELLPHNAVSTDGLFDSGEPSRNVDYRFVFQVGMNGTYEFVCEPHEQLGMVGTITVLAMNETQNQTGETDFEEAGPNENQSNATSYGVGIIIVSIFALLFYRYGALVTTKFGKK